MIQSISIRYFSNTYSKDSPQKKMTNAEIPKEAVIMVSFKEFHEHQAQDGNGQAEYGPAEIIFEMMRKLRSNLQNIHHKNQL